MTGRIHGLLAGAAFALYAVTGAAAFAQSAPPAHGPAGGPGPGRGAMMMQQWDSPAEQAGRLRDLLQLRSAQEPALQAFVGAQASARQGVVNGMMAGGPMPATTPERLARMQQMMSQHQAAAGAMIEATRRFYDQLDPAQKRAFDAMPMMMGFGMGPGMGMMMGARQMGWMMDGSGGPPPPPPPAGR